MKIHIIILLILAGFARNVFGVEIFIQPTDSRIYKVGTYYATPDQFIGFNWPCFGIGLNITGSGEAFIELTDTWNRYMVVYNSDPSLNYTF